MKRILFSLVAIDLLTLVALKFATARGLGDVIPWRVVLDLMLIVPLANVTAGQYWEWTMSVRARIISSAAALLTILGLLLGLPQFSAIPTGTILWLFAVLGTLHLATRIVGVDGVSRARVLRTTIVVTSLTFLFSPLIGGHGAGAGDGYWYRLMLADFVAQWRAGLFPAFVGQSESAFSGTVFPHRFAPLLLHLAGGLDILFFHRLTIPQLLNLSLLIAAAGAAWSMQRCLRYVLPNSPWMRVALTLLFTASPAVLAITHTGGLYMSMMTLPFIPWVSLAVWRAARTAEPLPLFPTAVPLAGAWLGHAPIAFWLTLILAVALSARWISLAKHRAQVAGEAGKLLLIFAPLTAFVFISSLSIESDRGITTVLTVMRSIEDSYPGILLPVSPSAALDSDYQLGLAVLVLLVVTFFCWIRKPDRSSAYLYAAMTILLVLVMPVPVLTRWLWSHVPQLVLDATYNWPMQRLPVIALALGVLAIASALHRVGPRSLMRWLLVPAIWIGVLWSHREATHFVKRGHTISVPPATAETRVSPNNAVITRYSFFQLSTAPYYFSHGYVDPFLTLRLLSPDGSAVLDSNLAAVERLVPDSSHGLVGDLDVSNSVPLSPRLNLQPGARHYLAVEWPEGSDELRGTLSIRTMSIFRTYWLPDSGFGSTYTSHNGSFGIGGRHASGISVWTEGPQSESIELKFTYESPPAVRPPTNFMTVHRRTYTHASLPIKIDSLLPLRASTLSPAGGSILETPRMYIDGYAARVNGKAVDVLKTAEKLVGIPLPEGPASVELVYSGPLAVRVSYWIGVASWSVLVLGFGLAELRRGNGRGSQPSDARIIGHNRKADASRSDPKPRSILRWARREG